MCLCASYERSRRSTSHRYVVVLFFILTSLVGMQGYVVVVPCWWKWVLSRDHKESTVRDPWAGHWRAEIDSGANGRCPRVPGPISTRPSMGNVQPCLHRAPNRAAVQRFCASPKVSLYQSLVQFPAGAALFGTEARPAACLTSWGHWPPGC